MPISATDAELDQLRIAAEKAKLRAQIEQSERTELFQTLLPGGMKPIEARTTVDARDVIEAEILAYRQLKKIAPHIAREVSVAAESGAILIHADEDMVALTAYRAFAAQMRELAAAYDAISPPLPADVVASAAIVGGALFATTAAVKTVVDLIALFRTERNVVGVTIEMSDLPLISEVANELRGKKRKVFVPRLYPMNVDVAAVERQMDAVRSAGAAAAARVNKLPPPHDDETQRLQQLDKARASYENLLTQTPTDRTAMMATLVRGAAVDQFLSQSPPAHVLYLKLLKAGGSNDTKRSFFGSSLKHTGGVVANWILLDEDGSILLAGTVDAYSGEVEDL